MLVQDVSVNGTLENKEIQNYIDYLERNGRKLMSLNITVDGDYVDLDYKYHTQPFERIRRITGYLVGDMRHWNNGKTAEERDRVKHHIG